MKHLSVFFAFLLVSGFFYFLNPTKHSVTDVKPSPVVTERTSSDGFITTNKNYSDLTVYEKSIVDSFFKDNPRLVTFLRNEYGAGDGYQNEIKLKLYSQTIALFYVPISVKGGYHLVIYDIKNHTSSDLDKSIYVFGNTVESSSYLIFLDEGYYDHNIRYLQSGSKELRDIPNSKLSNTETYVKQGGFGNVYEASLSGNTLKVSVFKNEVHSDTPNTKLREVTYVLP